MYLALRKKYAVNYRNDKVAYWALAISQAGPEEKKLRRCCCSDRTPAGQMHIAKRL